ncbi:MAG: signal transduction histidine kinase [Akkermansiaceae bacterium]|jgi:signal transduction histidine kinase
MVLGTILDFLVYPDHQLPFFLNRVITFGLLLLGFIPLALSDSPKMVRLVGHWVVSLPMVAIGWMICYTGDGESPYYAGLNLVLVGASLILRWRFSDSVINACICLLGYIAVISFLPGRPSVLFNNAYFIGVTAVFTCAGTYFYNQLRFREFVLRSELDTNQKALEENNAKLKALDEAKTRFFANISHELRTPLTLILGPVENLKNMPTLQADPKVRDTLETLSENGFRLLRLINDLLDLVRLDTGDVPLRPENINLPEFLGQLGTSLRPMAETQKIALQVESNLPKHPVLFYDRDQLEKIILNLSINALKFTPAGGKVFLGLSEEEGHFTLTVSDTGKGMNEEELARIFERFWQADGSSKRKARGTGIGLALVKSLTENLDGEIAVKSAPGEGTTFELRFPIRIAEQEDSGVVEVLPAAEADEFDKLHDKARLAAASPGQHQTAQASGRNTATRTASARASILIVDDESGMRSYIASQLEDYHLLQAADGRQGWELAKQHIPDLIVLDLMMPEMDGMEVCRLLREHPPTARIPIVLVTAHAGDAPRLEAIRAGVNDFLTKPFSSIELKARINNLLLTVNYERDLSVSNKDLSQALEQLQENEEELVRAEKLSSLGRMSAGIIHEINNPLNYAKTSIHILKTYSSLIPADEKEDYDDVLIDLEDGVERVINIVTDLRAFTRGDETTRHVLSLHKVVANTCRLLASDLNGINFTSEIPEEIQLEGNDNQLCQAFVNLIQNALRATAHRDDPVIKLTAQESEGGSIQVQLEDNGVGITPENQAKVFDPFFTTRDVGDGMGLGLSLTLKIIEGHRGRIHVESELGHGSTFIIYFPPPHQSDDSSAD